ncbi:nucleoside phosphorylase [Chryseosolibacter indicus]|uniref:Uridine phosphorylase n=1 Tax=Chryseosolibacter indicus TaxID=2782351 RepID=A0ABS5VY02_9BACT|nr:nucleoside phosphorylase [Chryseosolibacter indicus]MBT1706278.1 nucleoside phosphorylase [Chryseosolibacter indicus]
MSGKISDTDLILNPDGSVYHLNLLPKHISDTIITVGDPNRVYRVSQHFDEVEFEMNKREFITHVGVYNGKRITVISSGIGTDNVEILLTELDALANIDLKTREIKAKRKKLKIIRIGTSGSLQEDIAVGSHLASDYAVGFDNLMEFYELDSDEFEKEIGKDIKETIGLSFNPYVVRGSDVLRKQLCSDMIIGNTVTCPGFYAPQGRVLRTPVKYARLLESLTFYHNKTSDFWLTNFEMETAGYYALGKLLGHEILSVNAIIANRIKNKFATDPNQVVDSLILKILERI